MPKAPDDQDGQGELSEVGAAGLRRFQLMDLAIVRSSVGLQSDHYCIRISSTTCNRTTERHGMSTKELSKGGKTNKP